MSLFDWAFYYHFFIVLSTDISFVSILHSRVILTAVSFKTSVTKEPTKKAPTVKTVNDDISPVKKAPVKKAPVKKAPIKKAVPPKYKKGETVWYTKNGDRMKAKILVVELDDILHPYYQIQLDGRDGEIGTTEERLTAYVEAVPDDIPTKQASAPPTRSTRATRSTKVAATKVTAAAANHETKKETKAEMKARVAAEWAAKKNPNRRTKKN